MKRNLVQEEEIIKLKCGEDIYKVDKSVLLSPVSGDDQHYFVVLLSGKFSYKDERGFVELELDPEAFKVIMNYVQNRDDLSIFACNDEEKQQAVVECADFLLFKNLVKKITDKDIYVPKEQTGCFAFKKQVKNSKSAFKKEIVVIEERTHGIRDFEASFVHVLFPLGKIDPSSVFCIHDNLDKKYFLGVYFVRDADVPVSMTSFSRRDMKTVIYGVSDRFLGLAGPHESGYDFKYTWKPEIVFGMYDDIGFVEYENIEIKGWKDDRCEYGSYLTIEFADTRNVMIAHTDKKYRFGGALDKYRICIILSGQVDISSK